MRKVTLSLEAAEFISSYVDSLIGIGLCQSDIELVSAYLIEFLYIGLPQGRIRCIPQYLYLDPIVPTASIYSFEAGPLIGFYSALPDLVHVIEIGFPFLIKREAA